MQDVDYAYYRHQKSGILPREVPEAFLGSGNTTASVTSRELAAVTYGRNRRKMERPSRSRG